MPTSKRDNRAIKDHVWLAAHGKKIPQAGIETPSVERVAGPIPGGGSPRSPSSREGSARLGAPYGDATDRAAATDPRVAGELLAALSALPVGRPPTLAELVALRAALPPPDPAAGRASLADRFLLPPFSVLDARQGYWQKRKKMWLELGIQSELGRGENLQNMAATDLGPLLNNYRDSKNGLLGISEQARSHYRANAEPGGSRRPACSLGEDGRTQRGDGRGRPITASTFGTGGPGTMDDQRREWMKQDRDGCRPIPGGSTGKNSAYLFKTADGYKSGRELQEAETASLGGGLTHGTTIHPYDGSSSQVQSGTSIFDPVLCELAYRWWCPQAGRVLDPFAGGSVRGIMAARLGRAYAGVDLRQEQADANYAQAEWLCQDADLEWAVGDSRGVAGLLPGEYDFVFSCPPYADLERYSDDPRDLSTMDYPAFLEAYREIIAASCAMLRDDRFACFVVGDVRDRATGCYRGFVGDTVEAFRAAGLELYNEAVLVTAVGSLPIRVGKQFSGYRKLGKTHQNVLVFAKGDPARAAGACGEVDVGDLDMPECRDGAVAACLADVAGLAAAGCLAGASGDAAVLPLPAREAALLADLLRGEAAAAGRPAPRLWVGTPDGWAGVGAADRLSYLAGGAPYLSRAYWPKADAPADAPPPPRRLE